MSAPVQCVIDASVAVKVFLPEPLSAEATALIGCLADVGTVFHVPDLFFAECGNIFWKPVRRGNAQPAQAQSDWNTLSSWRLCSTPTFALTADALAVAITHDVTAYDACYVVLAQRQGIPLITADDRLVRKLTGSPHRAVWLGHWALPSAPPPTGAP